MAVITKIQVQQRNKSRYNIFLNRGKGEEYAFSVAEDVLIKYGLKKGLELNEESLIKIIDEDEKKKTYFLAINYLSYRMRSIEEMRVYLLKKEKELQHINEVIEELTQQKLLDDQEFARAYIRSKQLTLMKGPLKLKQELLQKGVKDVVIDGALEQFQKSDQKESIIKWLDKQKMRSSKLSNQAFIDKLSNQLQTKGFTRDVIKEALKEVDMSNDNEEEWESICFQGEKAKRKFANKYSGWEFNQRIKQALYQKGFSLDLIERYIEETEETV
ncbi:recombination regulator RecX [Halalkalibacter alkalisediminis]|uniref:Regulatory protein RecX n=1 Tax=Halalkalibacter alkalisediminis TaxID=935616 RepID=A0ABV6NB97_9BACI